MSSPHISVVVPIYGCVAHLDELVARLSNTIATICESHELILVDDRSPDNAWSTILALASIYPQIKGIRLSRNFGQHNAITVGLDYANGDWIVVMDCDLQDIPEQISILYAKAMEGYDLVVGRRVSRQDGFFKKFASKAFYMVFSYLTNEDVDNRIGNFGIYSKTVIENIRRLREKNRSFGLFALWVGFRRIEIDIEHAKRPSGCSTYSFQRMVNLALDSILAHSDKLLRLFVKGGFLLSVLSIGAAAWIALRYIFFGAHVIGWTSLIVAVFLSTGLIIATVGIVGLYVGKIFDEVKGRPLYIIDKTTFS